MRLSVERLDDARRDRTAAILAWLTLEQLVSAQGSAAWHDFVAETLRQHVMLWIPDLQDRDELGPEWWNEVMGLAFLQFVRDNELSPSINQHLERLQVAGGQA